MIRTDERQRDPLHRCIIRFVITLFLTFYRAETLASPADCTQPPRITPPLKRQGSVRTSNEK